MPRGRRQPTAQAVTADPRGLDFALKPQFARRGATVQDQVAQLVGGAETVPEDIVCPVGGELDERPSEGER